MRAFEICHLLALNNVLMTLTCTRGLHLARTKINELCPTIEFRQLQVFVMYIRNKQNSTESQFCLLHPDFPEAKKKNTWILSLRVCSQLLSHIQFLAIYYTWFCS